ncbi:MAG TPA: SRPBCC family protein [Gemmatimonadaceae bacterium]|nr:SRPBCC family protein [Gemmatimonadaceae bacterium]
MAGTTPHPILHSTVLRTDTQTATLAAPPHDVFEFVADPENLPRWAVGFCRSIRRDETSADHWVVTTGTGDIIVRYVTDRAAGVIDFHLSLAPGFESVAYSRVVPNADGAEYIFTQLQPPGMPDEVFEAQVEALREELIVLQALVRARLACGT